jgi:hypothetical protein
MNLYMLFLRCYRLQTRSFPRLVTRFDRSWFAAAFGVVRAADDGVGEGSEVCSSCQTQVTCIGDSYDVDRSALLADLPPPERG